jgi:CubicO group peptidase (beta-lactamase class C family)
MIFWIRSVVLGLAGAILWVTLVVSSTLGGWFREPIAPHGDTAAFAEAARALLEERNQGNVAYRLLSRGRLVDEAYLSIGEPVDADTLFQVASLSKWVTAWGVLALVDEGLIDLDAPVNGYLSRWQLPAAQGFAADEVTVRRLLSHTAGLTDGLGYGGFEPGEPRQSLEESLTRAADASSQEGGITLVGIQPGSEWRYSGGGYTLLQLLIEEVSGQRFEAFMQERVLDPLEMLRSTFEPDLDRTSNVAVFYDENGRVATHYRYTALAAASLYTTAADLSALLKAVLPGADGEPAGRGVISEQSLKLMATPHAALFGADIWGLGALLYAPTASGGFIIGHDGNNTPAINTAARVDPATGDGIVVLETGSPLLATHLAGEWVFWQTGVPDMLDVSLAAPVMISRSLVGSALVFAGVVAALWLWRRRRLVSAPQRAPARG